MHSFGLLPESNRAKFIATVSNYAVQGEDLYGLDNIGILRMFTDEEFEKLRQRIREELIPRLGDVRRNVQLEHGASQAPDVHMQQLLETFNILAKHFDDNANILSIIEHETQLANEWIADYEPDEPDQKQRTLGIVQTPDRLPSSRSIFDDIDA